jgi:hypothetical protein
VRKLRAVVSKMHATACWLVAPGFRRAQPAALLRQDNRKGGPKERRAAAISSALQLSAAIVPQAAASVRMRPHAAKRSEIR